MKTTTITFRGTRKEVRIIGAVAKAKGMDIGELVRDAIYTLYGKDIKKMLRAFPEDANGEIQETEDDAEDKEHDLLSA